MIHVDQNQHTAILSPHSTQNLILPREKQFRDWTESTSQKTGRKSPPSYPDTTFPGPTTPKDNQPIAANPEAPSTPASPADGNSASPTREHSSSSLSPVPDTAQSSPPPPTTNSPSNTGAAPAEPSTDDRESRQSTPLSELSPPPDDDDPPLDEKKDSGDSGVDAATKKEHQEDEVKLPEKSLPSPNPYPSRSSDYVPSPSISPNHSSSHSAGKDPKVATILELNSELFKILLELQARGVNPSDVRFQQFATRLQSNLNFLATAADRPSNQSAMTYPMMDAPPFIDILSTDRIQQLYVDLANVFQKSITRRPSLGPGLPNNNHIGFNHLKRERSDEPSLDMMAHKRRDTGEGKSSSNGMMMPPPSLTLQDQLSNGISTSPSPSTRSGSSPMPMPPQASTSAMSGMIPPAPGQGLSGTGSLPDAGMSEAQLNQAVREQQRMANMRAQQQRSGAMPGMPSTPQPQQGGRHMSPPSSSGVALSNPQISPTSSNHSGPSNIVPNGGGGLSSAQQIQQQAYAILQSQPPHPILQYMHRMVNNFGSLSYHDQARRIFQVLQMRQQQQQSVQHQMGGNGMPNGAFPNHSSPISPIAQQAQMNPMMLAGGQGMNSGSGAAMSGSVGGAGNSSGMNGGGNISMNQMTPNQRQQLMLMQQQRGGGIGSGGMNPMNNMNMNGLSPQQFAMLQQQRQQHSGQQGMSQNATSPTQQHHGRWASSECSWRWIRGRWYKYGSVVTSWKCRRWIWIRQ
ncbi:hypothetical protein J3R30DRAFT_1021667 [Lentinula aciculospora]|uniref:Uncharacterized protein n=1 Tax=Lentinula aciculospora TaxID=153920 RepID=A0A9W9A186_9AGAR|nr:hypothetical protein J3R30DRAFT_1021667 [Lentinula aciculospora]